MKNEAPYLSELIVSDIAQVHLVRAPIDAAPFVLRNIEQFVSVQECNHVRTVTSERTNPTVNERPIWLRDWPATGWNSQCNCVYRILDCRMLVDCLVHSDDVRQSLFPLVMSTQVIRSLILHICNCI